MQRLNQFRASEMNQMRVHHEGNDDDDDDDDDDNTLTWKKKCSKAPYMNKRMYKPR